LNVIDPQQQVLPDPVTIEIEYDGNDQQNDYQSACNIKYPFHHFPGDRSNAHFSLVQNTGISRVMKDLKLLKFGLHSDTMNKKTHSGKKECV